MTTIIEAKEMVNVYREMLERAKEDIAFAYGIIDGLKMKECHIRERYHEVLTEYDNLTINRRRHFR